jgi:hypothetical protein
MCTGWWDRAQIASDQTTRIAARTVGATCPSSRTPAVAGGVLPLRTITTLATLAQGFSSSIFALRSGALRSGPLARAFSRRGSVAAASGTSGWATSRVSPPPPLGGLNARKTPANESHALARAPRQNLRISGAFCPSCACAWENSHARGRRFETRRAHSIYRSREGIRKRRLDVVGAGGVRPGDGGRSAALCVRSAPREPSSVGARRCAAGRAGRCEIASCTAERSNGKLRRGTM